MIFDGEPIVTPDSLNDVMIASQYKANDSRIHEQERDIFKMWCGQDMSSVLIGIENQTICDKDMPFRIIGYDGAAYRSQLTRQKIGIINRNKEVSYKERFPVVTMVLYYGEYGWKESSALVDCFFPKLPDNKVAGKISKYISDYQINIFDIGNLRKE